MIRWRYIKIALKKHYSAPLEVSFRQFRSGLIYFAVGLGMLLMANNTMEPSAKQEWVILAGLILGGIGFLIAMLAQIRSIISRVLQFWLKPTKKD